MNCNKCGNVIPENSSFCFFCGTPIEQPKPKKKKKIFWGVVFLTLLLIISGVLIMVLKPWERDEKSVNSNDPVENVVKIFFEALKDKDEKALTSTLYPLIVNGYMAWDWDDEGYEGLYKKYEEDVYHDDDIAQVKLTSYSIDKVEKLDAEYVKKAIKGMESDPNYVVIKEIYEVYGKYYLYNSEEKESLFCTFQIKVAICEDGKCYYWDGRFRY